MHPSTSLLFGLGLALSLSTNAQDFHGTPGGGSTQGRILDFPECAKSCITTPPSNYVNEFQAFCQLVPTKDCCIANACGEGDRDMTYQISQQICGYVGDNVPAFTCKPTGHTTSSVPSSTSRHSTTHASSTPHPSPSSSHPSIHSSSTKHSTSTTHPTSTKHTTSSKHSTTSSHTTLRTSTRSTSHSSHKTTSSTPSLVTPPEALRTVDVYNGFVGAACYSEGTTGLALDGVSFTSSNMTIESCLDYCEKEGWGWAGVQNGNQCYCGDGMNNGGKSTSAGACNMGCMGSKSENCGGKNALSVYQSG